MPETWLTDLWEAAKLAGPFGTLFTTILWYLERSERLRLGTEKDELTKQVINVAHAATDATEELNRLLSARRR